MLRQDGRAADELRNIKITKNYLKFAEGSCLIEFGNTKVICSASLEEAVPPFLRGKGEGWITSEYGMLPRSCKSRVPREASRGKISGRTHEIQRLVGRSLRSITDLTKLGERTLWIDCDVIQADGGTRTASITGSFVALIEAMEKMRKAKMIKEIPISDYVAAVSVGISNGRPVVDLNYEEDSGAQVDMNLVMTSKGRIIEIQGTAEGEPFSENEMDKLLKLAKDGIKKIITIQKRSLKDIFTV